MGAAAHADQRRIPGLDADDPFGGMNNNEVFRSGADMSTLDRVIDGNDAPTWRPTSRSFSPTEIVTTCCRTR